MKKVKKTFLMGETEKNINTELLEVHREYYNQL